MTQRVFRSNGVPPEWSAYVKKLRDRHGIAFTNAVQATCTLLSCLTSARDHHGPCEYMKVFVNQATEMCAILGSQLANVHGWGSEWEEEVERSFELMRGLQRKDAAAQLAQEAKDEDGTKVH